MAVLSVSLLSTMMDPAMAAGLLLPLYLTTFTQFIFSGIAFYTQQDIASKRSYRRAWRVLCRLCLVRRAQTATFSHRLGTWRIMRALFKSSRRKPAQKRCSGAVCRANRLCRACGHHPTKRMLPQRLEKMVYLGTTTIFFTVNLMKLPAFILAGQNRAGLSLAVWIAPVALY